MKITRFHINGTSFAYVAANPVECFFINRKVARGNSGVFKTLCLAARMLNAQYTIQPRATAYKNPWRWK